MKKQCHVDFFVYFPPIKSEKFECSWNHHRDVLKVVTPLSVSIHCQRTLWVQANSHNHCLLIRQHCQRALFGRTAWMLHCQNISVLHSWKRNWKSRLPEAEAWRRCCSPGARGCQNCLECLRWNPSTAGEGRRRRNLPVCSLPQQSQCRTCGEQTWAPRYLGAFACLKLPAAFLQSKEQGLLNDFLAMCSIHIPELWLLRLSSLLPFCLLSNAHPWHCFPTPALHPAPLSLLDPSFMLLISGLQSHQYTTPDHHVKSCLTSHPTLWAWQTSLNLAVQPWTSSGSAQLSYPSDPLSNPKWVRKQINYPSASLLHIHVHCHPVQIISSSLSSQKTQLQDVSTACCCFQLIFPLVFFNSFPYQKAPVLGLNLPAPLHLLLFRKTQLTFHL